MRTTLTIEDDVAFGLRKAQDADPKKPFKVIVNEVLRRGLQNPSNREAKAVPFVLRSRPIGLRKDLNFDNVEEVLDILEGPDRR